MIVHQLFDSIIDTVPQWYKADFGKISYSFQDGSDKLKFYSFRKLTPDLSDLKDFIQSNLQVWKDHLTDPPTPSELGRVRQDIALHWLTRINNQVNWKKLFAYLENLRYKTYENLPVTVNMIISEGNGKIDITLKEIQKILDPLAVSPRVYLRLDYSLNYLSFEEILWQDVMDTSQYKFHPEFLHPIFSKLRQKEYAIHLNQRGDVIILNKLGLLASWRKGNWYIYDVYTFKNAIVDIMEHYRVGCNLFEIMFDLSYRRHGALLVYDPEHNVLDHVINPSSLIGSSTSSADMARSMLAESIRSIQMEHVKQEKRKKQLFLEIANIDGAVIFDSSEVLAIGAMIEPHPHVGSHLGARTTAFQASFKWGGKPIKVSSDGDISILFNSIDEKNNKCDAMLHFL